MAPESIDEVWVALFAHRLREHWPRIALGTLEETARELWGDAELRARAGDAAASCWLQRCDRRYPAAA